MFNQFGAVQRVIQESECKIYTFTTKDVKLQYDKKKEFAFHSGTRGTRTPV